MNLGLIVLAAALVTWCFVRFNAKKRFSKDSRGKSNKYSKGPVDLQVRTLCIISTAAAVLMVVIDSLFRLLKSSEKLTQKRY